MSGVKYAFFDHDSGRIWSTKYDDADLEKQSLWKRELDFKFGVKRREGEADSRVAAFLRHWSRVKCRYFTEPLYTTVAIFSAPAILSKFQNKSVTRVSEVEMKAAIMSAAPTRSGWAP
jgi:hypothetical protein